MYYNTTKVGKDERYVFSNKALQQDKRIELYFEKQTSLVGASQVWRDVFDRLEHVPLTSVRRSLNTLKLKGVLTKTTELLNGAYGRPECGWEKVPPKKQQQQFFRDGEK